MRKKIFLFQEINQKNFLFQEINLHDLSHFSMPTYMFLCKLHCLITAEYRRRGQLIRFTEG